MAYRGRGEVAPERPRVVRYGSFRPSVLELVLVLFFLLLGLGGLGLFVAMLGEGKPSLAPLLLSPVFLGIGGIFFWRAIRTPTSVDLAFFDRSREVEVRSRRLWMLRRSHRLALEGIRDVEIEHHRVKRLRHGRHHPGEPGARIWIDYGPGGRRALTDAILPGWREHELAANELRVAAGLEPHHVPHDPPPGSAAADLARWNSQAKSSFKTVAFVSIGVTTVMVVWSVVEGLRREQQKEHHGFIQLVCEERCMVGTVDDCLPGQTMRVGRNPGRIRIDVHDPETDRWRYEWVEVQTGEVTQFVCR